MVTPARLSEVAVTSKPIANSPLQSRAARPDRHPQRSAGRFLVPVPDAQAPLVAGAVPPFRERPERHVPETFELHAAASKGVVMDCLVRARARCSLSCGGLHTSALVVAADESGLLLALDSEILSGQCAIRCDLHDVPFLMTGQLEVLEAGDATGEGAGFAAHAVIRGVRIHTLDERRGTRVALEKGQGTLRWARVVDGMPKVMHSALVDLTPGGASIELSPDDPVPPSDSFVGELQLNEVKIPLLASVRRCESASHPVLAGLQLEVGREKHKLVDLYMRRRFPGLVPRHEVDGDKLGSLLADSGYLKLREGDGCSAAWHHYRSPQSLDFVYRARDSSLIGHVSITRSYRRTWLMHQLATLSGHAESGLCRRALYDLGSCAPTAFDGEQACALAYFNRRLRWHQLFFEEFVQWLNNEKLGTIAVFDRFERAPDACADGPIALDTTYRIEPLADDDVLPAVALIRSQVAPIVADALDINPQDLQTASLNGDALRSRSVLALRDDHELLGVALCETGPTSASLFNIFNLAQFYFCAGSARPAAEAQLALLKAVRSFYARRGAASPLIVAPPGTFAADQEPGTTLEESMGCVVISGAGLRQWEHYCRLQMGRLYQRKSTVPRTRGDAHVS